MQCSASAPELLRRGRRRPLRRDLRCFRNAAAHLEAGGYFVIEVGVPDLRRLPPGEDARVFSHAPGYVGYDRYVDLVAQQAVSHHFVADGSGVREDRTPFRYMRGRPSST
jgi:hypothetical protein